MKTTYFFNIQRALETITGDTLFEDAFITNETFEQVIERSMNPEIFAFFNSVEVVSKDEKLNRPTKAILTENHFFVMGEDTYYRNQFGNLVSRQDIQEVIQLEKAFFVA